MKSPISPDRLKELRSRNRLRQGELAQRSGISKDTISRLERGVLPGNRKHTIDQLSKALEVPPGVLTGELPLPDAGKGRRRESRRQAQVKVSGNALNALFLVARRYNVPMIRIIEIAPILFALAAEESLEMRRENLEKMKAYYEGFFPMNHVSTILKSKENADIVFDLESSLIEKKDVMSIINDPEHDHILHAPFENYIQNKLLYTEEEIMLWEFNNKGVLYDICSKEISDIVDGDASAKEAIWFGDVMLSEVPRHLWQDDTSAERLAWIKAAISDAKDLPPGDTGIADISAVLESEIGE